MVTGRVRRSIPAESAVFVYPPTPFIEVVGPTLVCDRLECPDFHTVVQWDSYRPNFAGIGIPVLENDVATALAVALVAETLQSS